MKKYIFLFTIFSLLFSCKNVSEELISIKLIVDKQEAVSDGNDYVSFSVVTSSGEDVTHLSSFWTDGYQLTNNTFSSSKPGTYVIFAKYLNAISENIEIIFSEPLSISLEADHYELDADGVSTATFTVLDNANINVTSQSQFYVNDQPIDGNSFTSEVDGEFKVTATYLEVTTAPIFITFNPVAYIDLHVSSDKYILVADNTDRVLLSCFNNTDQVDFTSEVEFYVNDELLESNVLRVSQEGEYLVKAKYENSESSVVVINAQSELLITQRVFAELVAATWCPFCPDGLLYLESLKGFSDIIPMTIHAVSSNNDPFAANSKGQALYQAMGVTNIPTIIVDRNKSQLVRPKLNSDPSLISQYKNTGNSVAIAIETSFENNMITGKAYLSSSDYSGAVKVVALMTENSLVHDQRNGVATDLGNPIKDFVHNHVYRDSYEDIFGNEISFIPDNISDFEFSFNVNSDFVKDNIDIIIVACREDNSVINVQKVSAGSQIGY